MSDLVGNPEDRFSRVEAQILLISVHVHVIFELCCAKIALSSRIRIPCCAALPKHAHAIYRIFFGCKNEKFHWKNFDNFLIFAQNIDCGYTLEPPR